MDTSDIDSSAVDDLNSTTQSEGKHTGKEGEKSHTSSVVLDEWWRVRCFYDKTRPDFALIHGLIYTPVAATTRSETQAKAKKGKSGQDPVKVLAYDPSDDIETEDPTRYSSMESNKKRSEVSEVLLSPS